MPSVSRGSPGKTCVRWPVKNRLLLCFYSAEDIYILGYKLILEGTWHRGKTYCENVKLPPRSRFLIPGRMDELGHESRSFFHFAKIILTLKHWQDNMWFVVHYCITGILAEKLPKQKEINMTWLTGLHECMDAAEWLCSRFHDPTHWHGCRNGKNNKYACTMTITFCPYSQF